MMREKDRGDIKSARGKADSKDAEEANERKK